jgi:hypothetical protein
MLGMPAITVAHGLLAWDAATLAAAILNNPLTPRQP